LHYVKIGTHLIPKEFVMREQSLGDLSDEQVSRMLEYLNSQMGNSAKIIDGEVTYFETSLPDKAP
jgi:hypothetical protein